MSYLRQISLADKEPVSLPEAKQFARIFNDDEDQMIKALIVAAREMCEVLTGRAIAKRSFVQVLDAFPYYVDAVQSQQAYPPNYYSLPRYSTTLWNYSQLIKLGRAPVWSVELLRYVKPDGTPAELTQDVDFVLDRESEPARILPKPGRTWPPSLYVANSVEIEFTAGYDPNPKATADTDTVSANPPNQQPDSTLIFAVPETIRTAILMLVAHWYANREPVSDAQMHDVPLSVQALLGAHAVVDFAPTGG
jgi:hypothetical protein